MTDAIVTEIYQDTLNIVRDGFRRMIVNAHFWCLGMEDAIKKDMPIAFVGPYNPVTFSFGGHRKAVKPSALEGWESPILSSEPAPGKKKRK